jgi:MFS family permease
MCTPAVPLIQKEFGTSGNNAYQILIVTIWEFGEAFAPLLVAPLSETYGRLPIIHISNVFFIIFSIASAVSASTPMLVAFRFFNGLAVSIIVLAPSIVGDLFVVEERGKAMALMGLLPLLGPLAGPAIGGYVSETIGWRWMFWITAAATGLIELGFVCFFRETYKVTILERKAECLRKETGNPNLRPAVTAPRGMSSLMRVAFIRPARMLFLSKIIFLNAFYVSVVFSYIYFLLTTITEVFQTNYGFSTGAASLTFLALGMSSPRATREMTC